VKDFAGIFIGEKGQAQGASRHGHTASPLIDGDHLIAEVGGPGAGVVCFDKKTGAVIWKSQDDLPGYAPPMIGTAAGVRQFIAFTAIGAIGLDPTNGKLLWRVPIKTPFGRHAITPVVDKDIVVVSSHQVGLMGIKLTKQGAAMIADVAWNEKESAINFASPVDVGGYLFGVGPHKNMICVEIATGKQLWSKDDFFPSNAGKAYAGIMVMGKNILLLTDDGQLVMFAADPKEYREISRCQGCGTNWCNPAYADGKLFMRDAKELRCMELLH
jgi:outer membrane protein assembly factor BamB